MNPAMQFSADRMVSSSLMDVLIRLGLISFLAVQCYWVLQPFLHMLLWAVILAVTLYPLQRWLAARLGGRQGSAAAFLTLGTLLLIMGPLFMVGGSLAESATELVRRVTSHELTLPMPSETVAGWPLVGQMFHDAWAMAATDLPRFLKKFEPQLQSGAKQALVIAAGFGGAMLTFAFSIVVAGIMMAFGESGARSAQAIFGRLAGRDTGPPLAVLATSTIRAVAQGVIGVAFIQALLLGVGFVMAGIPGAGLLAMLVLLLCIAQIPAGLVSVPVIAYIWASGYETVPAIGYTIYLLLAGTADNVLKPLLLARGVDAPMPVILLGALGGAISAGMIGMFVGAVMLAVGYQIFMVWVYTDLPEGVESKQAEEPGQA